MVDGCAFNNRYWVYVARRPTSGSPSGFAPTGDMPPHLHHPPAESGVRSAGESHERTHPHRRRYGSARARARPAPGQLPAGRSCCCRARRPEGQPSATCRRVAGSRSWDGRTANGWGELASGAEAIVNLAGESIAGGRWSARAQGAHRRQPAARATAAVVEAIAQARQPPRVLVQGSAVGYYGDRADETLRRGARSRAAASSARPRGPGRPRARERSSFGVRRVLARTGVVLAREGGAFPEDGAAVPLGAGAVLGSGKQWMPWIHLADEIAALEFLLGNEAAHGAFNLTAPAPVTQAEFSRALARSAPPAALRPGARLDAACRPRRDGRPGARQSAGGAATAPRRSASGSAYRSSPAALGDLCRRDAASGPAMSFWVVLGHAASRLAVVPHPRLAGERAAARREHRRRDVGTRLRPGGRGRRPGAGAGDPPARSSSLVLVSRLESAARDPHLPAQSAVKAEDYRYRAMRERQGPRFVWLSAFTVFGLQGILLLWPCRCRRERADALSRVRPPAGPLRLRRQSGSSCSASSCEAVGDAQLTRFRANPANRGKVCDVGLWR